MARSEFATAVAIAAFAALLYLPTLRHGYVLDDLFIAQDNPVVTDLRWLDAITAPWWPRWHGMDLGAPNWRPLATLSIVVERAVAPARVPGLHHAVNALLHGGLVLALLPLARRLAGSGWAALAACALFAAHPAHTEAVAPVVGRSDLLGALGLLAGIAAFLRHRETGQPSWLAVGVLAFAVGLAGKESAVPLLVLLPCADLLVRGEPARALLAPRRFAAYLPFAAVAAIYAAARIAVLGRAALVHGQPEGYDLLGRLAFAAHNAVVSLNLLVHPVRFHHLITTLPGDAPRTYPLPEGLAAAGFAAVAIAIGGGWIFLVRCAPRGAFAWLAAVVTWIPTSGLVPAGAGVALRFLLLPSAFAACGAAIALDAAVRARPALRPVAAAVVCLAVGASAATTLRRVPAWRDNGALFESVRVEVPDSYGALLGLGSYLQSLPQPDHVYVRSLYHRAIEVAPEPTGAVEARLNLAYSYASTGEIANVLATYADAIAAAPNHFEPRLARAMVFAELGRTQDALADFDRALVLNPALPEAECLRESIRRGERPWRRLPSSRQPGRSRALPPENRCGVASVQAE